MDRVVVYTNEHYDVVIGAAEITEFSADLYKVINRQYGLVEAEMSSLPTAILAAEEFSDYLKEVAYKLPPKKETAGRLN